MSSSPKTLIAKNPTKVTIDSKTSLIGLATNETSAGAGSSIKIINSLSFIVIDKLCLEKQKEKELGGVVFFGETPPTTTPYPAAFLDSKPYEFANGCLYKTVSNSTTNGTLDDASVLRDMTLFKNMALLSVRACT